MLFSFGKKKRRVSRSKLMKKPPARLLSICKRYKVKSTKKSGRRRVYKSIAVLKKECLKKAMAVLKKLKKAKKSPRRRRSSSFGLRRRRRSGFGLSGAPFVNPEKYGYNQAVQQSPQTLSQSSSVVDDKMNNSRPDNMKLAAGEVPTYGVYRNFFGQDVPTQLPPEWNFMGQPDGSLYPVGAPFQRYTTPITSFGKKRRYNVAGSPCNKLHKRVCQSNPNCSYSKRGCKRRSRTVSKGLVFEGPSLPSFGKKRRYRVAGSPCNKLHKRVCQSNPNCSYSKRGCRRRSGTVSKGLVFEGPSLPSFGRKSRFGMEYPPF